MATGSDRTIRRWSSGRHFVVIDDLFAVSNKSIVVLISGRGSNLQAIIDAVRQGRIDAGIAAVISNRADAAGLRLAEQAGIDTVVVDQKKYSNRTDYDHALIATIDNYNPNLVVLAGFMRILSDRFVQHYRDRVLNIHPSLLPEFKGLHTHRRALEAAAQIHGASVHFVSNELDSGPVVLQAQVPVLSNDTESSLAARVLEHEHIIYPIVIAWFIDGRLEVSHGQVMLDNRGLNRPAQWKSNQLVLTE